MTLSARRLATLARITWRASTNDDVLTYSAALAFHATLAVFPFLALIVSVLARFQMSPLVMAMVESAQRLLPPSGAAQLLAVIEHFQQRPQSRLLSLATITGIWATAAGVRSAIRALNRAYRVSTPRSTWKRFLVSVLFAIALAVVAIAATMLLTVGPELIGRLVGLIGLQDYWVLAWRWLRIPAAVALLLTFCAIFYSVLPNVRGFRWFTPGAAVAVTLWLPASLLFRLYTSTLADYGALYGGIGAMIVLLLYAWLSATALLIGAELNGVLANDQSSVTGTASIRS